LIALALASTSCGPAAPAQAPDPQRESEPAAASATPSSTPDAPTKPPPEAESTPSQTLARELLKSGGRRIAWSSSKKRFLVPVDARFENGRGLDLRLYDDEGNQRDIQRVCQPGECEEQLDEIVKGMIPKLAARLDGEGFEGVSSIGWPDGRDEIDVGTLGAKLRYERGGISIVRDGKATALRSGARLKAAPTVVYPVPAAKLLGVIAGEFRVLRLP
jgi:hypothetical protein